MITIRPATVSRGALHFCRGVMAILFWATLLFRIYGLLWPALGIFLLSALLKIRRAPLVWVYTVTIERCNPSGELILDENAMRFAHLLGAALTASCLLLHAAAPAMAATILLFLVTIAKTAGALGFCAASRMYGCLVSGNCCRTRRRPHD
jgi:hypothetical protein